MNTTKDQKVKLGVVGIGARGRNLLKTILEMEDVEVPAVCDVYEDRIEVGQQLVEDARGVKPVGYKNYKELITHGDLDGLVISTSWTSHAEIAIAAMKAGIYPASEVGAASTLQECWDLIRVSEETGIPCMMLENCNYGRDEMMVLNIVKKGLFGELVHCQAGYQHDLRGQVAKGIENRHYRFHMYKNRDMDNYPTHGLGPVAKCLNINRGNRFVSLTSISSKARGVNEWAKQHLAADHPSTTAHFNQGDIVTTTIKCANGETVVLTLDTTLPRPYSRAGRVQGTKGLWMEDNNGLYFDGKSPNHKWESIEDYREEHDHPLWKDFINKGVRGGHGGMDYLVIRAYLESIVNKTAPPIDVYDMAVWRAVSALSEQSIAQGGAVVNFPDFTNGKWIHREPATVSKYALDQVHEELFN